jgi:perosamine synthetase
VWPPQWDSIRDSLAHCWQSGDWGRYESESRNHLQRLLQSTFEADHLIWMPSGSAAIEWSLRAAGVGHGDAVVLAALDYPGNLRAIELIGGRPILVDIEAGYPRISVEQIQRLDDARIKALIVSHLYGVATDVHRLRKICDDRGWVMVEDACQVPGMIIDGRPAGSFGHLGTLSFGGSKPLTAGCGGAILTSDDRLHSRLRTMIDRPSEAYAIPPVAAAVLIPQVERLAEMIEVRRAGVQRIVANLPCQAEAIIVDDPSTIPSYYKLAVRFPESHQRDHWIAEMSRHGMPVGSPFRSMHRIHTKRADQPFPIVESSRFADQIALIDHRMLM